MQTKGLMHRERKKGRGKSNVSKTNKTDGCTSKEMLQSKDAITNPFPSLEFMAYDSKVVLICRAHDDLLTNHHSLEERRISLPLVQTDVTNVLHFCSVTDLQQEIFTYNPCQHQKKNSLSLAPHCLYSQRNHMEIPNNYKD